MNGAKSCILGIFREFDNVLNLDTFYINFSYFKTFTNTKFLTTLFKFICKIIIQISLI